MAAGSRMGVYRTTGSGPDSAGLGAEEGAEADSSEAAEELDAADATLSVRFRLITRGTELELELKLELELALALIAAEPVLAAAAEAADTKLVCC
jgi:hypothetical protein